MNSPTPPALEVRDLAVSFGSTKVLHGVDMQVAQGEVHGLLGVNGSGKSTLIKALAGLYAPDRGRFQLLGAELEASSTPQDRWRRGLRVLHQDVGIVERMSVADNLFVTRYPMSRWGTLDTRKLRLRARSLLDSVGLSSVRPDDLASRLGPTERSLLGIARALDRDDTDTDHGRLIVLDEPTAALPADDVHRLFEAVRTAAGDGSSFLFVTHEIEEVLELTDNVTVLRDGRVTGQAETSKLTSRDLVRLIVGREVEVLHSAASAPSGDPHLTVRGLSGGEVNGVNFHVHSGEVLGLTGLVGAGHEDVPYLVIGAKPRVAGEIVRQDGAGIGSSPAAARNRGVTILAGNRDGWSAIPPAAVRENVTLGNLSQFSRWYGLAAGVERRAAVEIINELSVRPAVPERTFRDLSGGNQQKALLGRVAHSRADVLLLHSPTQGVDVGARREIFDVVRELARQGRAIVYVTNDYSEAQQVCDRVIVMRRGVEVAEFEGASASHDSILSAAVGG